MNITQFYLTLNYDTSKIEDRAEYQNGTTYIQLFIEECLRKDKVDLGAFNRLVFSEGGDPSKDFAIVGNNALPVAISDTWGKLRSVSSDREAHNYYVGKLLEGFKKFDSHFKSSYVAYLEPLLDAKYESELHFEQKMAAKRIGIDRIQVVGRYYRTSFKLLVNIFSKRDLVRSEVIFECEPNLFAVKYDAHKVEITDSQIHVKNKIHEVTLKQNIEEFI